MSLLSKAIEANRLDLAAHALVLATLKTLSGEANEQKKSNQSNKEITCKKEEPVNQANKSMTSRAKVGLRTGFYEKVLDTADAMDFKTAAGAEGLDDEITLLRVSIKALVADDPKNIRLIMQATNMLAKLVKIRYSMTKGQKKNLGEAIKNVIRDIGVPLGVAVINKKL